METTSESAARLLARIQKLRSSPLNRVAMASVGLTDVLEELQSYIESQELRWEAVNANLRGLARVTLRRHFGQDPTREEFAALQRLAANVVTIEPADDASEALAAAARTMGAGHG